MSTVRKLCIAIFFVLSLPISAFSQSGDFRVPKSLREQVDFWILVFTKYGENQILFHHRDDAGVIYSVIDFTKVADTLSPGELEREKYRATEAEIDRIRATLQLLAEGKPAETAFERRLSRLFTRFGEEGASARFRDAMEVGKIRTQVGIRERYRDGLRRAGQYLPAMEAIFRERGLPIELTRLPFVESSFNYDAYSSVGAAGIWQFMRSTGKKYMKVGAALDERRDPIIATRAAASYLEHAYDALGAWSLAVTSYNHGIAGVARGVQAVGSRDISALIRRYNSPSWGFASKNFYTEFLAAVEVERNWKEYFPELEIDSAVYFDEVRIGKKATVGQLIRVSGLSSDEFYHLNPAYRPRFFALNSSVPVGALMKVPRGEAPSVIRSFPGSQLAWRFPAEEVREKGIGRPKVPPKPIEYIPSVKKSTARKAVSTKKSTPVKKTAKKTVVGKKSAPVKKSVTIKKAPVVKKASKKR